MFLISLLFQKSLGGQSMSPDADLAIKVLDFIKDEYEQCRINETTKFKLQLQVAAEMLVKHDSEEWALRIMYSIPEMFYGLDLEGLLEKDELFALQMRELASQLEKRGLTSVQVFKPTQAASKA